MLVFEDEITSMLHRDICRVKPPESVPDGDGVSTVPLGTLAGSVAASLDEGVAVTGITVYDDPEKAWEVNISRPRRASVCVDQYTGEIKGRSERPAFFAFMFRLHRWLLDSMKPGETVFWGKTVVGVSTIAFVIVLISGLAIWWKNSLKVMKNRLKISVSKGWRPFWYSLHIAGGAYACIFLLAMALTGLTWSFGWYRTGFYKLFGAGTSVSRETAHGERSGNVRHGGSSGSTGQRGSAGKAGEGVSTASWQAVYMELARRNPGYSSITVSDGTATVSSGSLGNRRASDRYTFDRVTGEITGSSLYRDSDRNLPGFGQELQDPRMDIFCPCRQLGRHRHQDTRVPGRHCGCFSSSYRLLHVDTAAPAPPSGMRRRCGPEGLTTFVCPPPVT